MNIQPPGFAKLYPFQPRIHRTALGAAMSYLDEGPVSDEAVLMLHGNPTWSFYYRELVKAVSPTMRCIVPDHIGMGLSEKPQKYPYTLAQRIEDIEALVTTLGLKRIHLVVHDWGGAIGMGLATRHPELIGRIVILNTAAFVSKDIPFTISLCRLPVLGSWIVRSLNGFAGPAAKMAMHSRRLTLAEKRAFLYPYGSFEERVAVHAFVKDIPLEKDHVSRGTLESIEQRLPLLANHPKRIIWGGRDFCFNDRFLTRWQQIFPGVETHRLAGAGHYVLEDSKGEAVRLAVEFLTK